MSAARIRHLELALLDVGRCCEAYLGAIADCEARGHTAKIKRYQGFPERYSELAFIYSAELVKIREQASR
jgi:hypothetical protein